MLTNKHIDRIVIALVLVALVGVGVLTALLRGQEASGISLAYEDALFSTDQPMTVNILIDGDDWHELLDTALSETYYCCDVEINGETYYNVGIRAKGNTSLSSVAASDSDRFSFKIQFDEYTGGQTCQGLDKLVLNNNYADATMMKESVTYDMFAFLGADASLYQYAEISVNGDYWGIYLALEAVEESFAMRNYGSGYGQLYKPENMKMGGGKEGELDKGMGGQGGPPEMNGQFPEMGAPTEGTESATDAEAGGQDPAANPQTSTTVDPSANSNEQPTSEDKSSDTMPSLPFGGGGPDGMGGSGSTTLNYIDDNLDSYSAIWDASIFDSTDGDHKRVVTALQQISQGDDLETFLDVDNMLRYMAVQTFVVNLDSLTGNMAHNYYLYEDDGQLNLIPWDYNLAFGGFQTGDASSMVNFPIDTPFSGVTLEDRQFFKALFEDPDYLEQYHNYLNKLVEEYIYGGRFDTLYHQIRDNIDKLVEEDPTAFYTYEEYDAAAQMLYDTVYLRAESIEGQLDGSIPSTTDGQSETPELLLDASSLDLSVMGSQMGAIGGPGEMGGFFGGEQEATDFQNETPENSVPPDNSDSLDVTTDNLSASTNSAILHRLAAGSQNGDEFTNYVPEKQTAGQQTESQSTTLEQEAKQSGSEGTGKPEQETAGDSRQQKTAPSTAQVPKDDAGAPTQAVGDQGETVTPSTGTGDGTQSQTTNPRGQQGGPGQMPTMGSAEVTAVSQTSQIILVSGCMVLMLLALFGAVKFRRK